MSIRTIVAKPGCAVLLTSQTSAVRNASATHAPVTMRVVATAYCDKGRTASGVRTRSGIVAADPQGLPLGTVLMIFEPGTPYAGTYTVLDTGGLVRGREIDIFMPSCANAARFGRKRVRVRVIRLRWDPRASAAGAAGAEIAR